MHIDELYKDLLNKILTNGKLKHNRTGVDTLSISGHMLEYDMDQGFPILTTKKIAWKTLRVELEGFIKGITDKRWFQERSCSIWNEFSYVDGRTATRSKEMRELYQLRSRDLGVLYGSQWRRFDGDKVNNFPVANVPHWPNADFDQGEVFSSKGYGDFIILDKKYGSDTVTIQFLYNGYKTTVTRSNARVGSVKNPYYPKMYDVGCLGCPDRQNPRFKELYVIWANMISRCYNKNALDYTSYGAKGVYVSNDWLVFEYFMEDATFIDGWSEKLNDWCTYTLDKDMLQRNVKYKVYSKNTCVWLHYMDQFLFRRDAVRFDAISPEGDRYIDQVNLTKFCNEHGVDHGDGNRRMNGKLAHKPNGWDFINRRKYYKESEYVGIDQLAWAIHQVKTNPNNRRIIVTAWNPKQLNNMALPPCHYGFQLLVNEGTLDLLWNQR